MTAWTDLVKRLSKENPGENLTKILPMAKKLYKKSAVLTKKVGNKVFKNKGRGTRGRRGRRGMRGGKVDPNAPSVKGQVDPNAPSVEGQVDPNAPSVEGQVDPNAPSVEGQVDPNASSDDTNAVVETNTTKESQYYKKEGEAFVLITNEEEKKNPVIQKYIKGEDGNYTPAPAQGGRSKKNKSKKGGKRAGRKSRKN
jgi:hypothetical protein